MTIIASAIIAQGLRRVKLIKLVSTNRIIDGLTNEKVR